MFVVGCSSQLTEVVALQAVSVAASAAVPTIIALEATGKVSSADATLAINYAGLVGKAASEASTELASSDTTQVKITAIIGYFEPIAAPSIGSSSPDVFAAVSAIEGAVSLFLTALKSDQTTVSAVRGAAAVKVANLKLGLKDKHIVNQVKKQSDATCAKVGAWKPVQTK